MIHIYMYIYDSYRLNLICDFCFEEYKLYVLQLTRVYTPDPTMSDSALPCMYIYLIVTVFYGYNSLPHYQRVIII